MKFDCLVVDAPWEYNNKRTGGSLKSGSGQHYETMNQNELIDLQFDIQRLSNENSILFLWATNSFLPDALDLIKYWGFEYKTMITWLKKSYGLGYWFRGKTEHILFGVKGYVKPFRLNVPNIIISGKTLKHSQKPIEFYSLVQKAARSMLDNNDYLQKIDVLELFARKPVEKYKLDGMNWTCLGKEITGNDIKEDLKQLLTK